jgi:uncharacterized protein YacL
MINMMRKKLLNKIAILIVLIFIVNLLAMQFFWYSSVWYFDMPMHFSGGVFLGLLIAFLFHMQTMRNISVSFSRKLWTTVLFVFIIGFGWEVFEVIVDKFISHNPQNILDTMSDMFFDLSGGVVAFLYYDISSRIHIENK